METVLITGGSRGIGRAIVRLFRDKGYNVAFTYLNSVDMANELAETTGAFAIKADSANAEQCIAAVNATISRFGKIDVLVNNAAICDFSLFTDLSIERWNEIIAANLTSAFVYSRECAKNMLQRKHGSIVNISSMWGIVGSSCEVAYSTAKAGMIGMTKALAK